MRPLICAESGVHQMTRPVVLACSKLKGGVRVLRACCSMSSSMLLSAEDLAKGEINTQSETCVKAGRSFAVPIRINTPYTVVSWEFTVQPKVGVCGGGGGGGGGGW